MRRRIEGPWKLAARELFFRLYARHRRGPKPNIALYCFPRSGSTWVLNTMSAHPGLRQMTRPFMSLNRSRHRKHVPDLARAAGYDRDDYEFWHWIHFEPEQDDEVRFAAGKILRGEWFIYPTVSFWLPYTHRTSERLAFQITHATSMIEWFDEQFDLDTFLLIRHPISTALSNIRANFRSEHDDFLKHRWFVDTQLTGAQMDLARDVIAGGSPVAALVLDWTLRMLIPLRAVESGRHPEWFTLTYEQAVLRPRETLEMISKAFDLPDVDAMMAQVKEPSRTVSPTTIGKTDDPDYLVKRWKKKIGAEEERELLAIPRAFGLDLYEPGRYVAADRLLHGWKPAAETAPEPAP